MAQHSSSRLPTRGEVILPLLRKGIKFVTDKNLKDSLTNGSDVSDAKFLAAIQKLRLKISRQWNKSMCISRYEEQNKPWLQKEFDEDEFPEFILRRPSVQEPPADQLSPTKSANNDHHEPWTTPTNPDKKKKEDSKTLC